MDHTRAHASEDELLLGLATGADDHLTKPYSPRELVARVRTTWTAGYEHLAGSSVG